MILSRSHWEYHNMRLAYLLVKNTPPSTCLNSDKGTEMPEWMYPPASSHVRVLKAGKVRQNGKAMQVACAKIAARAEQGRKARLLVCASNTVLCTFQAVAPYLLSSSRLTSLHRGASPISLISPPALSASPSSGSTQKRYQCPLLSMRV